MVVSLDTPNPAMCHGRNGGHGIVPTPEMGP